MEEEGFIIWGEWFWGGSSKEVGGLGGGVGDGSLNPNNLL